MARLTQGERISQAKRCLVEKRFNQALSLSEAALAVYPECIDSVLVRAIAFQQLGSLNDSMLALRAILQKQPTFVPAKIVLAEVLMAKKAFEQALPIIEDALKSVPEHAGLWREYSNCLNSVGRNEQANQAFKQHLIYGTRHPPLRSSIAAFFDGEFAKAERQVRRFLQSHPNDVSAIRLLAEIALKLGILADAQTLLERALSIAPDYHLARLNYAHTLNKRERSQLALEQIEILEKSQPQHLPVQLVKAAILIKLGFYQQACDIYSSILSDQPGLAEVWCSKGHAEKTLGNADAAILCYKRAIAISPGNGEPYWSLANLKTYQFSSQEIDAMEALYEQDQNLTAEDRAHLCFALGKAHETAKRHDNAFSFYQRGNDIKRKIDPYQEHDVEQLVQRNIEFFSSFKAPKIDNADPTPIFILGLPRSGSTLLEQILSSHSQIDGTKELPDVMSLARRLGNKRKKQDADRYPESLKQCSKDKLVQLGSDYLAGTQPHRKNAPFFIDKMPNNFLHIGLIKTILPNAKIIDARRDATATCFSCYKQLFAVGQTFTYNLSDLRHYYSRYLRLMDFWNAIYPNQILKVEYEAVVNNVEAETLRILNYLELPFESACLSFYKNSRAVATASSEQVRQPINAAGLDAWKPYQQYLSEIMAIVR